MFKTTNKRVEALSSIFRGRVEEIEKLISGPTIVYIDWANVIHQQDKIEWHFNLVRIKQFLDSFDKIKKVRLYFGTLDGNDKSESQVKEVTEAGYELITKPVKVMSLSIDVSSIANDSPEIVNNFLKKSFIKKLDIETIAFLNSKLKLLNQQGILKLEELKCNFDVEIGRDMLSDFNEDKYETYVLWSGDSDFHGPISQ